MGIEHGQRSTMFITGPIAKVEDELANLTGDWAAVDWWHHVIRDEPCLTVRLIPTALLRQMQLMQLGAPRPPRMQ